MTRDEFQQWLDRYVEAWKSYDPAAIGALFSEDAVYRYAPADDPVVGRDAIVADWLSDRDAPGSYAASYAPLAIDGDVHVAHGQTDYYDAERSLRDRYWNAYVCRFNAAGECREFTDYWMQDREFRKRDRDELVRRAKAGEV